LFFSVANFFHS